MIQIASFLLLTLVSLTAAQEFDLAKVDFATQYPALKVLTGSKLSKLVKVATAIRNNGCNTNLCFALQGGSGVTNAEYLSQKNFVDLVVNIVTTDRLAKTNYAGVQYHTSTTTIRSLDGSRAKFLRSLQRSSRVAGGTSIVAGVRWCSKQLRPRDRDANKAVILSNGFATVGRGLFGAARRIRRSGGNVCAVAVGPSDREALRKLTGSASRVVNINQFFELSEIIVDVVRRVCNV